MKCSIPKGTRDFLPAEMARRNYIFDTIREVFKTFAFEPIETPSLENLSTLLGKYGEEGDKLLFKVLNSGEAIDVKRLKKAVDYIVSPKQVKFLPPKIKESLINSKTIRKEQGQYILNENVDLKDFFYRLNAIVRTEIIAPISEKGLRYDLTVPFARFVVQHRDQITLPFRRYQLQPVWRADRPQKGRYREFYQCDADMIGSTSLLNELELVQMIDAVFQRLGVEVTVKINNRKVLAGIAEHIGAPDKLVDITVAIDKLDKIGLDNVRAELRERGLDDSQIAALDPVFALTGDAAAKLSQLATLFAGNEVGTKGVEELKELFGYIEQVKPQCHVELDLTLARGLNYYTGAIFEVKAHNVSIGSICGGGRYDNLTGIFGMPDVSGVGISFGADRIYDVLTELDKFPANLGQPARALFINFGVESLPYAISCAAKLRASGISTLIYPDNAKMKKQMDYANRCHVPFVIFVGENEIAAQTLTVKDMTAGTQSTLTLDEVVALLKA